MVVTSIDISTPAVITGAVRFGDVLVVGGTGEWGVGRDPVARALRCCSYAIRFPRAARQSA